MVRLEKVIVVAEQEFCSVLGSAKMKFHVFLCWWVGGFEESSGHFGLVILFKSF